jgi:GT2 family glycosyltransferase
MRVAAAVVSWNTRELLLACLDSLREDAESGLCDVWVVDNGSIDGSVPAARDRAPWAQVIETRDNLGFGRAVNAVARQTDSEWILAANADVALGPGALRTMLGAGSDPRIGCVAPRLIMPNGSTQHSVYPFPTLPLTVAFNLGLTSVSRRLGDRLCLEGRWNPERPRIVPWAIGACLLIRRTAFDEAGGFDERQWMYAEDVDLGWRLRARGWPTAYVPSAHVRHVGAAATRSAFGDQSTSIYLAATYAMLRRRRGAGRMRATYAANLGGAALRLGLAAPLAPFRARSAAAAADSRRWLVAHARGYRSSGTLGEGT